MGRARIIVGLTLALLPPFLFAAPIPPKAADKIAPILDKAYYNPARLKAEAAYTDSTALPPFVRIEGSTSIPSLPIRGEILPGGPAMTFGYLRLRTLLPPKAKDAKDSKEWASLEADVVAWNRSAAGLVLDLRRCGAASGNPGEFAAAARIASWFVSPNRVLFLLQSSRASVPQQVFQSTALAASSGVPLFFGHLVVLVNPETGGAGATLAAVLRREAGAVILGRTADDSAALFQVTDLGGDLALRVPVAAVQLPDGSDLLGSPVTPDIALYIDDKDEREILAQTVLGPAARGLVEAPPRHHMNEASLVHEENPEIADLLTPAAKAAGEEALPLQDTALLRAVDILKGLHLFPVATQ